MNISEAKLMLAEIVKEIDYDIYKEAYCEETSEDDDWDANLEELVFIVEKYIPIKYGG
jgi:hypothetical protein